MANANRVFAAILAMFLVSQILGIYCGSFIILDAQKNQLVSQLMSVPGLNSNAQYDSLIAFAYILAGALFFYLLIKFYSKRIIFIIIEIGAVSFASSIVFYCILRQFMQPDASPILIAAILGLIFASIRFFIPKVRNIVAIISAAGAGAVFGFSLSFLAGLILLVLLSIYDYIAVFKTRHMGEFAKSIDSMEMPFAIKSEAKTEKGPMFMELGTGDLVMPIMLGVSGYSFGGLIYPLLITLASLFALIALFFLLSKKKIMLPAIPILAVFILLFLGVAKLAGII